MSDEKKKLGTCDLNDPHHPSFRYHHGVHEDQGRCVNWREQPAQGEPRCTFAYNIHCNCQKCSANKAESEKAMGCNADSAEKADRGQGVSGSYSAPLLHEKAGAVEGTSAEQFHRKSFDPSGITTGRLSIAFACEFAEAYAALKVREHVKAINRLEKAELSALAELDEARAKLREERDALKRDYRALSDKYNALVKRGA